ncbi:MAG TPA: TspO/MBR family protein [Gammaproteobacteria bacterium]|nr:TspO/MBR family protein [Gammaproteobacteria bacterium]
MMLIVAFLLVAGAAAFGGRFRPDEWYEALDKPAWNPPNWVFAPVWMLLYAAMAVAAWFVWRSGSGSVQILGLSFWLAQLVANAAWSWIFFGRHRPGWALLDISVMFVLILATLLVFFRLSRVAGWLMVPYLAWVGFAGCLNAALWVRNGRPGTATS